MKLSSWAPWFAVPKSILFVKLNHKILAKGQLFAKENLAEMSNLLLRQIPQSYFRQQASHLAKPPDCQLYLE